MAEPRILFRDDDLLVVDKPAGLPTTAPSRGDACLVRWVEQQLPGVSAHPSSRLDSLVSGLVTFALRPSANRRLLDARRARAYERAYLGISLHEPRPPSGRWEWAISLDRRDPRRRTAADGPGRREAASRYSVEARCKHACLLRLLPETGRTHQLRVHASEGGAPLFGDSTYGGERRVTLPDGRVVTPRRVMLHCARVAFPWGTDSRCFESPVADDMARTWVALGGELGDLTSP